MTISLKHTFASAKTDSADVTLVQPSNWNQEHILTLATNKLLGRATAGTGAAEEISLGTAVSISGGTLAVTNVPVANGGTGAATLTGYVKGSGTSPFTASATVPVGDLTGTLPVANGGTGAATLAANNVVLGNGTSAVTTVAPGTSGNVLISNGTTWTSAASPVSGSLDATATGSLSNGSTVVINTDGTVSIVTPTITPVPSAGTPATFSSTAASTISAAYDSVNQKVVVAFVNASNLPRAIVGTVSGTTITFGGAVTIASVSASGTSCVYDPNTQKTIVAYKDDTNIAGVAVVGTVSGTSISFGTPVNFIGSSGIGTTFQAVYDALAQRVVIAFIDASAGLGKTAVGAVSGTSITFGSLNTFSGASSANEVSAAYDANAQKVVITYSGASGFAIVGTTNPTSVSFGTIATFIAGAPNATSVAYDASALKVVIAYEAATTSFGTAVVGTVSGTSISFGTPVVFQSSAVDNFSTVYDASVQKVVISYNGTSNFGTAILGTVSGTSISFSTSVVFDSVASTFISSASAYNAAAAKTVTAYRISGSGKTAVISPTTSTPNLTSENFIGFSSAAYTNGQTATIQLVGSVNTAQSSLTAGQSYYVQTDGTLSLTAGSPSVFAGTAVAATKIIVKG